ncbi:MAG TPA: molybdopterin-dependent oxidoreductase, partial [Candidatus Dormibacteraeota bacterium]|nr:molybdopterin-dependent oxidoreductase [Candidatus Dormibacteraeota bacterium]
ISLPHDVTNEEAYLFRKLLDGPLKGAKVKMHGRTALAAPAGDTLRIRDIDDARVIVVVASDIEHDVPIVDLRVKKAVSKLGARLIVVYPDGVDLDRHPGTVHVRNASGQAAAEVRKLSNHEWLKNPGGPVAILFGDGHGSEDIGELAAACGELAKSGGGKVMPLYRATNERGALAQGVAGWDKLDGVEALLSWGPPPTAGVPKSVKFIAAWDHLPRDGYEQATILPAATFAERQGSYTNLEGTVQFLRPPIALKPPLREGWQVLCELGAALGVSLDYVGIVPIQREMGLGVPDLEAPPTPVLIGPAHP